ncbi:integrator complex subunit 11 [Vigna unguiculata]|uniref:RING-type E3 ubiquitin transferase n=1 Tax=Vigna unguiculata TaxID=3917 RepID=A0A4D6LEA2_VIGUN|nr:integrator complex subunit 11 [Vigna unguiculata]
MESPHYFPALMMLSDDRHSLVEEFLLEFGIDPAAEAAPIQYLGMIPASDEAVQTSLQKCRVVTENECCSICLEEMNVNDECHKMPCNHAFHHTCILTWLRTSHVCPLCRFPLQTNKE